MTVETLHIGFVALIDAGPLIVAEELGFAEEEGLRLDLRRAPSWSMLRDMLAFGQIDAAQLLAPVPIATALGLGGAVPRIDALQVLSVNGTVIGVSRGLADALRLGGHVFDFTDAAAAGRAMIAAAGDGGLRLGVPFPFSMQAELVHYWLNALGFDAARGLIVRTVPPPRMAEAVEAGEIDAFCVGEPWGSVGVERGAAELLLPGAAIWSFAPEKVLAVRHSWAETNHELGGRLSRAVWRAGRWLAVPGNRATASELLARSSYLDLSPEVIERALQGRLLIAPGGTEAATERFIEFHDGGASFPWRSQAGWIAHRLALRHGLDPAMAAETGKAVFRPDLYRKFLKDTGAPMPGASEKIEGATDGPVGVGASQGRLILCRNRFFDGAIFDPAAEV
ncbi:CmpA/NrtA family ABC transporter substrate-binding protein [Frigidibacter sp. MR17.24]|uniref:CmpA/NrtA family ABC transporter substrate-binding protein n=1 Tax=Frigidibacter sp. MR17.24 TaxID=3127345 RepID=UPI003012B634